MLVRGGVSGGSATDRVILRAIGSTGRALCLLVHCAYWECEKGVAFTGSPGSFGTLGSCRPVRGVLLPCLLCGLWELWGNGLPITSRYFKGISRS